MAFKCPFQPKPPYDSMIPWVYDKVEKVSDCNGVLKSKPNYSWECLEEDNTFEKQKVEPGH